ncbi:MAG TPA: hypothetical protein VGK02_06330 [Candidatus Aquicultor sp.]
MAETRLRDWVAAAGRAFSYDEARNTIIIDGSEYAVKDIATGKYPFLKYNAGGYVTVVDPAAFGKSITENSPGKLEMSPQPTSDDNIIKNWEVAANIRQDPQKYHKLFADFNMGYTGDIADKLYRNAEGTESLWRQINDMERLQGFADVHKFYNPDTPFTLETAKQYENTYSNPQGVQNFFNARDKLAAHGVEIKDLFNWGGISVNDETLMNMFQGKTGAESLQKQWDDLVKMREGATREEKARPQTIFDESGLRTPGFSKSYI